LLLLGEHYKLAKYKGKTQGSLLFISTHNFQRYFR
jgi:hypothetical protein